MLHEKILNKLESLKSNLFKLVSYIRQETNHNEIVLIGSLSVMGYLEHNKQLLKTNEHHIDGWLSTIHSPDFDVFLKKDPDRQDNLNTKFGDFSEYHKETSNYIDLVSLSTATLPNGWDERLISITQDDMIVHCLEPHDCATSKLIRGANNDLEWLVNAINIDLINAETLSKRLDETEFKINDNEKELVKYTLNAILEALGKEPLIELFDWETPENEVVSSNDLAMRYELQPKYDTEKHLYIANIYDFDTDKICFVTELANLQQYNDFKQQFIEFSSENDLIKQLERCYTNGAHKKNSLGLH